MGARPLRNSRCDRVHNGDPAASRPLKPDPPPPYKQPTGRVQRSRMPSYSTERAAFGGKFGVRSGPDNTQHRVHQPHARHHRRSRHQIPILHLAANIRVHRHQPFRVHTRSDSRNESDRRQTPDHTRPMWPVEVPLLRAHQSPIIPQKDPQRQTRTVDNPHLQTLLVPNPEPRRHSNKAFLVTVRRPRTQEGQNHRVLHIPAMAHQRMASLPHTPMGQLYPSPGTQPMDGHDVLESDRRPSQHT